MTWDSIILFIKSGNRSYPTSMSLLALQLNKGRYIFEKQVGFMRMWIKVYTFIRFIFAPKLLNLTMTCLNVNLNSTLVIRQLVSPKSFAEMWDLVISLIRFLQKFADRRWDQKNHRSIRPTKFWNSESLFLSSSASQKQDLRLKYKNSPRSL